MSSFFQNRGRLTALNDLGLKTATQRDNTPLSANTAPLIAYISGPSGGGKTTYARKHYPLSKFTILSTDDYATPSAVNWKKLREDAQASTLPIVIEGTAIHRAIARQAENKLLIAPSKRTIQRRATKRDPALNKIKHEALWKEYQSDILPVAKEENFKLLKNANEEFAPGIPKDRKIQPLPDVHKPREWTMALQQHQAEQAGDHYDLRLVDPETGYAHSWVLPSNHIPEPGKSVLAVPQPTHTSDYALTFGKDKRQTIEKGYGKGTVKIKALQDAEVYHSKADEEGTRLRFNLYKGTGPEEYAIVRTSDGNDRLVNKTLTRARRPELDIGKKPKIKEKAFNKIDTANDHEIMMPKYDGAHTLLDLHRAGKIPRLYSYRTPKRHTAGVIEHTHKAPLLLTQRVPKELKGTILRTETIGVDDKGKAIPAKDIAGMLNATVPNSRKKQKEMKATLRPIMFDIDQYRGKDVRHLPFSARYELLREIHDRMNLPLVEMAQGATEKEKLLKTISTGQHPLTSEGIILRPLAAPGKATKAKIRPDYDVYVRDVFEAKSRTGKPKGRAGGFEYSWTPDGPIAGRVGTGFDHTTAEDMLQHPDRYVGRAAKVEAEQRYRSGALGKPAFKEWHLDKGDIEKEGAALPFHESPKIKELRPFKPTRLSNQKHKIKYRAAPFMKKSSHLAMPSLLDKLNSPRGT
jgi:hypothetical protein